MTTEHIIILAALLVFVLVFSRHLEMIGLLFAGLVLLGLGIAFIVAFPKVSFFLLLICGGVYLYDRLHPPKRSSNATDLDMFGNHRGHF